MTRERRLGRGLEALLGDFEQGPAGEEAVSPAAETPTPADLLRCDQIQRNPFQPREAFDDAELDALADSLREHGLLQAILVRKVGEEFQLVAGERRLRAAQRAGWVEVPVRLIEVDDRQTAELAIVENMQRKDLNPLEKASSFQRYLDSFGGTQDELAGRLKVDRSTISNLIRLLELPEPVQTALRTGAISQGHARALLPLGDDDEQKMFCERIQQEQLSVREVEKIIHETIHEADAEPLAAPAAEGESRAATRTRTQHLAAVSQELKMALGAKVDVKQNGKERGKIVIYFKSHAEFDRLRGYLLGAPVPQSQAG